MTNAEVVAFLVPLFGGALGYVAVQLASLSRRTGRLEAWRRAEINAARPAWERWPPPANYGPPERPD